MNGSGLSPNMKKAMLYAEHYFVDVQIAEHLE